MIPYFIAFGIYVAVCAASITFVVATDALARRRGWKRWRANRPTQIPPPPPKCCSIDSTPWHPNRFCLPPEYEDNGVESDRNWMHRN